MAKRKSRGKSDTENMATVDVLWSRALAWPFERNF